jgi:hypothetical protein
MEQCLRAEAGKHRLFAWTFVPRLFHAKGAGDRAQGAEGTYPGLPSFFFHEARKMSVAIGEQKSLKT